MKFRLTLEEIKENEDILGSKTYLIYLRLHSILSKKKYKTYNVAEIAGLLNRGVGGVYASLIKLEKNGLLEFKRDSNKTKKSQFKLN
jgi:DNA-binding MarR family transcriptional regulator